MGKLLHQIPFLCSALTITSGRPSAPRDHVISAWLHPPNTPGFPPKQVHAQRTVPAGNVLVMPLWCDSPHDFLHRRWSLWIKSSEHLRAGAARGRALDVAEGKRSRGASGPVLGKHLAGNDAFPPKRPGVWTGDRRPRSGRGYTLPTGPKFYRRWVGPRPLRTNRRCSHMLEGAKICVAKAVCVPASEVPGPMGSSMTRFSPLANIVWID